MSLILGIDPGCERSAWCQLRDGMPDGFGKIDNLGLLEMLRQLALPRNANVRADLLAIEGIASYGMAVGKEVFDTCVWIGRYLEAWERGGGITKLVYRREVKLFLCDSQRANDANIRAALIEMYGPTKARAVGVKKSPGPLYGLKGDCWSALAVALTARGRPTYVAAPLRVAAMSSAATT